MIVNRTLSEKNDVLILQYEISVATNYVRFLSYTLNIVSNSQYKLDTRFRVSQDSYIYTEWEELNQENFSKIEGSVINDIFFIQFRFEVLEIAANDIIKIDNLIVRTLPQDKVLKTEILDNTIFSGLSIGNFETSKLCSNLLVKLMDKGIVPAYIDRSAINSDDYKSFWSTIATYMAMFVTYFSRFENMYFDRDNLIHFLQQQDIFIRKHHETLEDLQKLASNYYRNIQKRGTSLVFNRRSNNNEIDGEILRLFQVLDNNEFHYHLRDKTRTGIIMNKTSPIYKGVYPNRKNKVNFKNLQNEVGGTVQFSEYGISFVVNDYIGFDNFSKDVFVADKGYTVDVNFNYIIKLTGNFHNAVISFGCRAFDEHNNKYDLNLYDDLSLNSFFASNKKIDGNLILSGIIYSINTIKNRQYSNSELRRLIFNNKNITKISPYIKLHSGGMYLHNLELEILDYKYSSGFIGNSNFIDIFVKNNSQHTDLYVKNKIRQKMIPYNANVLFNISNEREKDNVNKIKPEIVDEGEFLPT